MIGSPSRGFVRKKWSVNRVDGPLTLYAEYVKKKLYHHFVPCDYVVCDEAEHAVFVPARGRLQFAPDFPDLLRLAVANVNADRRLEGAFLGGSGSAYNVGLTVPHHIDQRGELRLTK